LDDGACALHCLWGDICACDEDVDWISCHDARSTLDGKLPADVFRNEFAAASHALLLDLGKDLVKLCKHRCGNSAEAVCPEIGVVWDRLDENEQLKFETFTNGLLLEQEQYSRGSGLAGLCMM